MLNFITRAKDCEHLKTHLFKKSRKTRLAFHEHNCTVPVHYELSSRHTFILINITVGFQQRSHYCSKHCNSYFGISYMLDY